MKIKLMKNLELGEKITLGHHICALFFLFLKKLLQHINKKVKLGEAFF